MSDVSSASTRELEAELERRRGPEPCRCGKWKTCLGVWDSDGYTRRCAGCLRAVARCTCTFLGL